MLRKYLKKCSFTQYLILKNNSHSGGLHFVDRTVRGQVKMFAYDFAIANTFMGFRKCFLDSSLNKH